MMSALTDTPPPQIVRLVAAATRTEARHYAVAQGWEGGSSPVPWQYVSTLKELLARRGGQLHFSADYFKLMEWKPILDIANQRGMSVFMGGVEKRIGGGR